MEDRELEIWRQEWRDETAPLPEIKKKIERRNRRFLLSNMVAVVGLVAILVFATVVAWRDPRPEKIAWAVGIWVLGFVGSGYRLWVQRGTWRPAAQTTRAFVELSYNRAVAKVRAIRFGFYGILVWVAYYAALAVWKWNVVWPDVKADPGDWALALGGVLLMLAAAFLWLAWLRRRKVVELEEAKKLLEEMKQ
jgi:Na+/melibiose symporter-like transporter